MLTEVHVQQKHSENLLIMNVQGVRAAGKVELIDTNFCNLTEIRVYNSAQLIPAA